MSRRHALRQFLGAALVLALSLGLGACGKESRPSAPEGEESRYLYPQIYPKPPSVLPQGEDIAVEMEEEAEAEEAPHTGEVPTHVGGIEIFPMDTRSKTLYDSGPIE